MRVTSRQRMILDVLLRESHEITVGELAEQIEVSSRTIHRELEDLKPFLDKFGLAISRKAGVGIQIEGKPEKKEVMHLALFDSKKTEYTPQERKIFILCTLLESREPVKLLSLAYDLKVTTATISNDLEELEGWLARHRLQLIRKRGYGVEVNGLESAKREAIGDLITESLNEQELLSLIKDNLQNKPSPRLDSIYERLVGLIEKEKIILVENALKNLDNELPYPLADSAYIGLVIHLALTMGRIVKGEEIRFHEEQFEELLETPEYRVAERIVERLGQVFGMPIPPAEAGYITMHLRGAKLRSSHEKWVLPENIEFISKVGQFIEACERILDVKLKEDESLLRGLITHLEPALYRIQRNMKIRNLFLAEIKKDYPRLFRVVREAAEDVFRGLTVPDEEIGFLVMHVGASLERTKRKKEKFRALIVCSSGIGTSKILSMRIKKELPAIEHLRNVSLFDIEKIPKTEYDIIISTIPLPISRNQYILVNPLLTKRDIEKITFFFRCINMVSSEQTALESTEKSANQVVAELKSLQGHLNQVVDVLDGFGAYETDSLLIDSSQVLHHACDKLRQDGVLLDPKQVSNKLIEREKLGGLGIPGTGIALFHCRSIDIDKASFTIWKVHRPVLVTSMENNQMEVTHLLLLLAPQDISPEGLEVLSHISAMLIEEEVIQLLRTKPQETIKAFLAKRLNDFIHLKIGLER